MAIYTVIGSSSVFEEVLAFDVHPGSAQLLVFATGFVGLLILACSSMENHWVRIWSCVAVALGQLWNLAARQWHGGRGVA